MGIGKYLRPAPFLFAAVAAVEIHVAAYGGGVFVSLQVCSPFVSSKSGVEK